MQHILRKEVSVSPLRYPGGKSVLTDLLRSVLRSNKIADTTYIEPFAGGAGAGLTLLISESVRRLVINDADRAVYAFWQSSVFNTTRFLDLIESTPVTLESWHHQRSIYRSTKKTSLLRLGFAAFFLNRCNRSGIIMNGGPIGGLHQAGKWRLDARYNKSALISRIEFIARFRSRISVFNDDAASLLTKQSLSQFGDPDNYFIYLDPPYFAKGQELYLNSYDLRDHKMLRRRVEKLPSRNWLMTYDDTRVIRDLYKEMKIVGFNLRYSAAVRRPGKEVLIHHPDLKMPGSASR